MELKTCCAFLVLACFIEQTPGAKFGSTELLSSGITHHEHLTSSGRDMVLHATKNRNNQTNYDADEMRSNNSWVAPDCNY